MWRKFFNSDFLNCSWYKCYYPVTNKTVHLAPIFLGFPYLTLTTKTHWIKSWSFLKPLAAFPGLRQGQEFTHSLTFLFWPLSFLAEKFQNWIAHLSPRDMAVDPLLHSSCGIQRHFRKLHLPKGAFSHTIILTTAGEWVHNVHDISTCFYNTPVKYQRPRLLGLIQNTTCPQTRLFPRKCQRRKWFPKRQSASLIYWGDCLWKITDCTSKLKLVMFKYHWLEYLTL